MKLGKFILLFAVAFLMLTGIAAVDAVVENKTVVASGHPDWSPAMYRDDGKIVGTAPEIVTKAFNSLGMQVDCKYTGSWIDVQELGKRGEIDVIVAAYNTSERHEYFLYSENPIMQDNISMFSTQNIIYQGPETFEEYCIAVSLGDSYGEKLDRFLASNRSVVTVYNNPMDAMDSLSKGNDVFLYSTASGNRILKENPMRYKYVKGEVITSLPFYVLVSKQSEYVAIMPRINEALKIYASK